MYVVLKIPFEQFQSNFGQKTRQILGVNGLEISHKGVSYTKLVSGLAVTLKKIYYYYYYFNDGRTYLPLNEINWCNSSQTKGILILV